MDKIKDIIEKQKENNKIAIKYKESSITYKELYEKAISNISIMNEYKINRNIGIFISNSISYAVAYFSINLNDKVIIPIEDTVREEGLASIVEYCELSMIICNDESEAKLIELLHKYEEHRINVYNVDSQIVKLINEEQLYIEEGKDDESDVVIMLHTSGTTSDPKRVMLTNKSLITNIKSNIESLGLRENDKCLIVLPMFFGYCNSSQFLSHLYLGASLVIYDSTFLPRKFLDLIDSEKCTNTTCVPSMLHMVIKGCEREKYDLSSLRYLCFGGGRMPLELLEKILSFFNYTGVVQTYGQTEASPRVTCLMPEDSFRKIGSVGKAIPNVEVNIVDENGNSISNGEIGEIVIKGDNVMKGYYKKNDITDSTIVNGWLHTGDLGKMDEEGYLYIVGRIKNVIISGGLNIYPEEIEEVLLRIPEVKEAVVFPVKHNILGEVPSAKVVLFENTQCTVTAIIEHCRKSLTSNKVPSKVEICDAFEKTYTGKIRRIFEEEK